MKTAKYDFLLVPTFKTFIVGMMIYTASASAQPQMKENALKMVPGGQVVSESTREYKIQTKNQSIVEIEFETDGSFEEASGNDIEKDVLVMDQGVMGLQDAVKAVKKAGKTPVGEWTLDKSFLHGWYYEFDGVENGKKMEYVLDAKSGKLLSSNIDD